MTFPLNCLETEYYDISSNNSWRSVFQKINSDYFYVFPALEARKSHNRPQNRYRDVYPYDHSRIVLKRGGIDYINANLVKMKPANRMYILTQGPLAHTVGHFWLMVWEQNSHAILMLNRVIEKNEEKCFWYWPHGEGQEHYMTLADVGLKISLKSSEKNAHFITRHLTIEDLESEETREVIHFQYTTWPDFGVPSSPVAFVEFLRKVRASGVLDLEVGPPVVHCSAGIGRSGTFCLVDCCLVLFNKQREEFDTVNVIEVLRELRKYRTGLIQSYAQLRFSYLAIIEGIKRLDPAFVLEENLEEILNAEVDAEEEVPPPPPPRGESLAGPPGRPLPSIPVSASLGNLEYEDAESGSDSEEEVPPAPPSEEVSKDESDEEDEVTTIEVVETSVLQRRKRQKELVQRVSTMRRRARNAERWQTIKGSLMNPAAITAGAIIASAILYTFLKP